MPPRYPLSVTCALITACASEPAPPAHLPNLIVRIGHPIVQERVFSANACEVREGCAGVGRRRLLRFDLTTANRSAVDLVLGNPAVDGGARPGFEWAPCHMHFHLRGYADYRLLTLDGREAARGHKQGFCIEDSQPYDENARALPDRERYDCNNQGIHAGWSDVYSRNLDCQYVDVTDVAPGRYRLRVGINGERVLSESRYDDNVAEVDVEIGAPGDAGTDAAIDAPAVDPRLPCASGEQGPHRDCGWEAAGGVRTCTPGTRITVGCDAACSPPLGGCKGDAMLRLCEGDTACIDVAALAWNDDSGCASDGGIAGCAQVTVTCPVSGRYRVLTGAYRAGAAYACRVETR